MQDPTSMATNQPPAQASLQAPVAVPQAPFAANPLVAKLKSSFSTAITGSAVATNSSAAPSPTALPTDSIPVDDVISQNDRLDVLSAVIDQLEAEKPAENPIVVADTIQEPSVLDQALPAAVAASANSLNPAVPSGSAVAKERVAGSDQTAVEVAATVQYVEQEPSPEIPVEVETFIQRVEDHTQTAPHEVVIADGTQEKAQAAYPSRPVVVLPITQTLDEEGQKKSPKFSIRWLIEWSHKIIKMFAGKVIYRQVEAQ